MEYEIDRTEKEREKRFSIPPKIRAGQSNDTKASGASSKSGSEGGSEGGSSAANGGGGGKQNFGRHDGGSSFNGVRFTFG